MSAIPQPPRVHWRHDVTPVPQRPSDLLPEPRAYLENDVRKTLRPLFGAEADDLDGQVEQIMAAADEYMAAGIHLFARPEGET